MKTIFMSNRTKAMKRILNWRVTFTPLSTQDILARKTSDVLVVLGSGASINDISESQWEFIKKNDSLGFNFWFVHSFVPTFYHVEYLRYQDELRHYIEIMRQVEEGYRDVPFLVSNHSANLGWYPKYRPEVFPKNVKLFVYSRPIKKSIPRERAIEESDFQDLKMNLGESPYIARSSLTTVIHIGSQMGYKAIILAGVDLNNSRYFHEDMDCMRWYLEEVRRASGECNGKHPTAVWRDGEYHAVDTYLPAFNKIVLRPRGTELFIANKQSLLYPSLPYHPLSN